MKKLLLLSSLFIVAIFSSCNSGDATAYQDLIFGMSLEDVKAKDYIASDEKTISEEGMDTYKCKYSDYAGIHYDKAELSFRGNKLAKVLFVKSTTSAAEQQETSKKVNEYLKSKYGQAQETGKCYGWNDPKHVFLQYVHSEIGEDFSSLYVNELAICSMDYYKEK